jgi:transcription antitermination factor NusG
MNTADPPALEPGQLVQITDGPHAGKSGRVAEVRLDAVTGDVIVAVQTSRGMCWTLRANVKH